MDLLKLCAIWVTIDKASYLESPKPGKKDDRSIMEIAEESSNRYDELFKALAEIERKEKEDDLK